MDNNDFTYQSVPLNNLDYKLKMDSKLCNDHFIQQPKPEENKQVNQPILQFSSTPLLYLDINLGNNKQERIPIYENDKADNLAAKFALKYNLDSTTKSKFKDLIEAQIKNYLINNQNQ
eukprot:TRINITY_DN12263_c0_g1_i3.p3 TRINITY_DN12263_c0_g1~~TRINITY_DN12263_c0_g1_i3.p3  ORF type:complete len:118 (-),score=24.01 TRINITY_DN12263_c0_g1_i3:155-508(-)